MEAVRGEVTCPAYTARNGWTQDSRPGSLAPRPVLGVSLCRGRSDFPSPFWPVSGVVAGAEAGPTPESPPQRSRPTPELRRVTGLVQNHPRDLAPE